MANPNKEIRENDKAPIGRLSRIVGLISPYRGRFLLATLALFVASSLTLVLPQMLRKVIDGGLSVQSMKQLNVMVLLLFGLFAIQAVFVWIRHYLMSWVGERVVADLRTLVFDNLSRLPPSWFHDRRSGELVGRVASDVTTVANVIGSELSMALRNGVLLVGGVVLLVIQNPLLTLLMLAVIPPLAIGLVVFGRKIRKMSTTVQDRLADANGRMEEVVSGIDTVQSFVREASERNIYGQHIERVFDSALGVAIWRSWFMSSTIFIVSSSMVLIGWVGGRQVVSGDMSGGELAAFILYTTMVATALGTIAGVWGSLQRAAGATERIFEIIDEIPTISDPRDPNVLPTGEGHVRFCDVTFSYPSRPEQDVLQSVTIEIAPGEVVAVVGPSGAGKSTLVALLQRFHDPQQGHIELEGVDLRNLKLAELRGVMATVRQEPILFSGSVSENIAFGREGATQAEIEQAARDAHAHEFIHDFPDGYDTVVGERGVKLSGGQRQRVAIARALLANPRVLILDEATSSLDAESEALVQEALGRLMENRTTLIIAHRLSTVRDADRIVVLEAGQIAETGRHDELMDEGGVYRRLVDHQVQGVLPDTFA